ncbi:hypothetical protein T07_2249 [Trichinella nelsoni]|uniref:Uncharacterized protein n=1 Tax=Trichinella nelsoni TaxID=6336 RepID=A0A0V0S211_9BILA|nr:hypothetical protein T07_2249 [Trichinella nelsoni]
MHSFIAGQLHTIPPNSNVSFSLGTVCLKILHWTLLNKKDNGEHQRWSCLMFLIKLFISTNTPKIDAT